MASALIPLTQRSAARYNSTVSPRAVSIYVLSKSKLLCYLQCPKKLWLSVHREDLSSNDSEGNTGFTAGQKVGDVVRRVFDPKGTGEQVEASAYNRRKKSRFEKRGNSIQGVTFVMHSAQSLPYISFC